MKELTSITYITLNRSLIHLNTVPQLVPWKKNGKHEVSFEY